MYYTFVITIIFYHYILQRLSVERYTRYHELFEIAQKFHNTIVSDIKIPRYVLHATLQKGAT